MKKTDQQDDVCEIVNVFVTGSDVLVNGFLLKKKSLICSVCQFAQCESAHSG